MTNEEKAEEIANYNCTHICLADCSAESYFSSKNDCYKAAMEMAEWKEQQMIEKACEKLVEIELEDYKKKYEDANKRVATRFGSNVARELFSDLYESEDEKIRKAIHIYLDWLDGREKNYQPKGDYSIKDMIAWLEKQGEQILANSAKTCKDEQKPSWSEEDDNCINYILINCMHYAEECGHVEELHNDELHKQAKELLKSLKDRI